MSQMIQQKTMAPGNNPRSLFGGIMNECIYIFEMKYQQLKDEIDGLAPTLSQYSHTDPYWSAVIEKLDQLKSKLQKIERYLIKNSFQYQPVRVEK